MKRRRRAVLQIDWALFYLRWAVLLVVAVVAFAGPERSNISTLGMGALLFSGAAYNLAIMVLLMIRLWPSPLPLVALLADAGLAVGAYQLGGNADSALIWVSLFPAIATGMRYGWIASSALVAIIVAVAAGLVAYADPGGLSVQHPFVINALFLILGAVVAGLVGHRVQRQLVRQIHAERDAEERYIRGVRNQSRVIYEMTSLVSASLSYTKVLDAALDLTFIGLEDASADVTHLVSAILMFDGDELYVATARRLTPADIKVRVPAKQGILKEAVESTDPAYSTQPYRDPELRRFVAFRSCRSLMVVPLRAGLESYGVIIFGHPRSDFFSLEYIELLEAICNQANIAMQNARLYRDLQEEKERLVEVEEEARKKLARDLHDGPTQQVAAVAMRANYIRRLIERNPKEAVDELYKVEDLARRTTKEIRHMLFTLRPLVLESQGLVAALRSLADKMRDNHGENVIIQAQQGAEEKLDKHAQGVLFYIVEEAVNNARKHAEAAHIWVRLKQKPGIFVLEIEDDGVGFNVGAVNESYDQRGSLGMVNMRERTELVSGVFNMQSAEGMGTKITVLVPLTEAAHEKLHAT